MFMLLIVVGTISAQEEQLLIQQVRGELESKEISEKEVERRMIERGFNPQDVDESNIAEYQKALEEVISEIENEKSPIENETPIIEQTGATPTVIVNKQDSTVESKPNTTESQKPSISKDTVLPTVAEKKDPVNIYGHQIFRNSEIILYRSSDDISAPGRYVLSTGDELRVTIFGRSQADFLFRINEEGYIQPQQMPKVYLKGLTITEANELLQNRFARRYTFLPEQFSVVLQSARTITINIFGEVEQPGSYSISAINTGFNSLVAAGGPLASGSVRKIKLIKGNGETKILDVYEYLIDPKVQFDFPIDDQDIIHVPLIGKLVTVSGAVKRPLKYELIEGETLKDALEYAGGLQSNAYTEIAQITRIGAFEQEIIDLPLRAVLDGSSTFELQDGDKIEIKSIPGKLNNFVSISGPFEYPGKFNYTSDMNLQDLMDLAIFDEYARKDIAYLYRVSENSTIDLIKLDLQKSNPSEIDLQPKDRVQFFSLRNYLDTQYNISINGAVRNPGEFNFNPNENIRIGDLIVLSGGLQVNAHPAAIVRRVNPENSGEEIYVEVNVQNAVEDSLSADNIVLKRGDRVFIYTNERYNNLGEVSISGQVRTPTTTQYDASLTIQELLLLAGSTLPNAAPQAMVRRYDPNNIKGVTYIPININEVLSGESNFVLQKGDRVQVYDQNTFIESFDVQILGEVRSPIQTEFDESLTLEDLVYMAGGFTLQAAKNNVEIYRIEFEDNNPNRVLVQSIDVSDKNLTSVSNAIELQPLDLIVVRSIPNFKYQEIVYIGGEVQFPGPYLITEKKNKLSDIVKSSGGLTRYAFPEGATLERQRGDISGKVSIDLNDAIRFGNMHEDIVLLPGDRIYIPREENLVSINTFATKAQNVLLDETIEDNSLQLAYQGPHNAKWYIDHFVGGLADDADKRSVRVINQNGRIEGTKTYFWFIHDYPLVEEGSQIIVDFKEKKPEKEEREGIDWESVIRDGMAIASSALTIIVLATRI